MQGRERKSAKRRRVAFYIADLKGGGAERSLLQLAAGFIDRGYEVDLVLDRQRGPNVANIPAAARVFELGRNAKVWARLRLLRHFPREGFALLSPMLCGNKPHMTLRLLPSLVRYLGEQRPDVMITALGYAPFLAIWARQMARVGTRLVVTEHSTLSRWMDQYRDQPKERRRRRYLLGLIQRLYPRADAIVGVSDGVCDNLAATAALDRRLITTIYNPVVSPRLAALAAERAVYPWFDGDGPPLILAVGRLVPAKEFPTLIEAFALLRKERVTRLMIIGEGLQRPQLEAQIKAAGLNEDVALPGWRDNPYAFMRRAQVLVLSSAWEGLGNVLIEAMACGCPVVATDCPSGPREILDDGRYGTLVPVGDAPALARAMSAALDTPQEADTLRRRANDFSMADSVDRYQKLIEAIAAE